MCICWNITTPVETSEKKSYSCKKPTSKDVEIKDIFLVALNLVGQQDLFSLFVQLIMYAQWVLDVMEIISRV